LDLFIPIKHSSTSIEEEVDDKDDDDEEHQSHETDIDFDDKNMKSEWLKSVQLWNQSDAVVSNNRQDRSQEKTETLVELIKINDEAAKKNNNIKSPVTTSDGGSGGGGGRRGQRKNRRCWSQELHRRFLNALKQLGGPHGAFLGFKLKHIYQ
jgi:hypothetical protein